MAETVRDEITQLAGSNMRWLRTVSNRASKGLDGALRQELPERASHALCWEAKLFLR